MRPLPSLAVLLVALSTSLPAAAQPHVGGRVTDAATGEGLPGVTIQVDGTFDGTTTNGDGFFAIRVDALPAVLVVRHIGYVSQRVTVAAGTTARLAVSLTPATHVLPELVVTDEDPAVGIMREVIARKQVWRAALASYAARAYDRFTVSNDTGIVMIGETLGDVYWKKDEGTREVLRAQRRSANLAFEDLLPDQTDLVNLYDDEVDLAGFRMIGVTHPKALDVYDFRLAGRRMMDERIVYDIDVRPRRRTTAGFVGRVAVLDSAYALLAVDLQPGEAFVFPPPIAHFGLELEQQFSNFGGDFWLPVDFRVRGDFRIGMGFLLSFPNIHIEQAARLTGYVPNAPVPDSLFARDTYLTIDSAAVRENTLSEREIVPLSTAERVAYAGIDSSLTFLKAFAPRGLLARMIDEEDMEEDGGGRAGRLRFVPHVRHNRIQGPYGGLTLGRRFGPLTVEATAGYATASEAWDRGGRLRLGLGPGRRLSLEGGYYDGVVPRVATGAYDLDAAGVVAQLGGGDRFDYFRNERVYGGATYRLPETPLRFDAYVNDERHRSLFFAGDGTDRANPAIPEGRLRSVSAGLRFGDELLPGVTGGDRLALNVEHAAPGLLGGDFGFSQVHAIVDLRVPTLLRRRFLPATLDVRLAAGASRGQLPPQRVGVVPGATGFFGPTAYAAYGELRTLRGRAYEGDRYVALFAEHSFRTLPFELLGWRWPVRRGYNVVVHGGLARTWLTDDLRRRIGRADAVPDGFHTEVGLSLSGLFMLFRLDVAWRLDAPGFTVGVGPARLL